MEKKESLKRSFSKVFLMSKRQDIKIMLYTIVGFLGGIVITSQLLKIDNVFINLIIGIITAIFGYKLVGKDK